MPPFGPRARSASPRRVPAYDQTCRGQDELIATPRDCKARARYNGSAERLRSGSSTKRKDARAGCEREDCRDERGERPAREE